MAKQRAGIRATCHGHGNDASDKKNKEKAEKVQNILYTIKWGQVKKNCYFCRPKTFLGPAVGLEDADVEDAAHADEEAEDHHHPDGDTSHSTQL